MANMKGSLFAKVSGPYCEGDHVIVKVSMRRWAKILLFMLKKLSMA